MFHSLRWRIFFIFLLAVMLILVVAQLYVDKGTQGAFTTYVATATKERCSASQVKGHVTPSGQELSCLYTMAQTNDFAEIQAMIDQAAQQSGEHLIVVDQQQHIVADSAHQFDKQSLQEISTSNLLDGSHGPVVLIVASSGNLSPDLGIEKPQSNSDANQPAQGFNNSIKLTLFYALFFSTILALLFALLCSHMIIKPIKALTRAAQAMEQGDLSQRVRMCSKNEIGILARAFNTMAEAQERFEQLRRNMISDIAHELRTPLTNIRGYLEGIQDRIFQPTPAIVDSLYEESVLLTRLVTDLQDLSQAEAGQLQLYRRPMELTEVVYKAVQGLMPGITEKEIFLTVTVPGHLPEALIDPERIGQVLRNLLSNAIIHTPERGIITVKVSFDEQRIFTAVEDNGDGIAPEHLPYIFERFYRTDISRSRTTGGSGLGLAIVKQLVQAHNGTISINSEVGKGSCFCFSLPVSNQNTT
jgi:signal transduction histidine kinase